ncbi:hypothetical protein K525DRAFT_201122 [Schizophyllum commune Loenen D]|nr:hypothetical protein K525DRAFT_201122 [Schizophyllum commune Loenen D]
MSSERLLCPVDDCPKHYVNVGNVNRHRKDDHGHTIPEGRGSELMSYQKIIVPKTTTRGRKANGPTKAKKSGRKPAAEVNASTANAAKPSRRARDLKKRFIPPLPPLPPLAGPFDVHASDPCADSNIDHVDASFGTVGATLHPIEGPIPVQLPSLTGTAPVSSRTPQWATPPPPYPAHPAGLPDDYGWARQGLAQPAGPSEFVDEKFPSFDAPQRAHSPRPLAYQPAAMVGYPPVPVADSSSAPTMGFPSAPTTAFPPVPPPQEVFWRDQIHATMLRQQQQADDFRQQRRADAFRRQQEFTFHQPVASAQHPMAQAPRREQDAVRTRAQRQQVEDPWVAATMQQLHALAQQNLATSAATHFPMDLDRLAPQAGTSELSVLPYASYSPPPSNGFSLHPRDRVVHEQRVPPVTETPFFSAFDSCHFPALEPRQQTTQTPFADVYQELTGAASSAPHFGDAFIPWSSFE